MISIYRYFSYSKSKNATECMVNIKSKNRTTFILLFILLGSVSVLYYHYFVAERVISTTRFASIDGEKFDFTVTSKCKSVNLSTPTPYVSVQVGNVEILTTAVNSGYDSIHECLISSIERVDLSKDQKKLRIYMKDGRIKEIDILGYER